MGITRDPLDVLAKFVARFDTQKDAATELGISQQYLNDIIKGRRKFSGSILDRLGLRRVVVKR